MSVAATDPTTALISVMLSALSAASQRTGWLEEDTPLALATQEFFRNNWQQAQSGLLSRTRLFEVTPEDSPVPRVFHFILHRPYKRQVSPQSAITLAAGPICGVLYYREDLLSPAEEDVPTVAVMLHDRSLIHPNFNRRHGLLCLGSWGSESGGLAGPVFLGRLLEHLYRILSYQNISVLHPADVDAATYFATERTALDGLRPVRPLY